jgi:DNA invertase Pin-like site-specific DNA recombinase
MSNSLVFGSLIRVSTEKQEQQGESLRTQRLHNERDVALLGGTIAAAYGGQEHATANWEKKELLRLTADAKRGLFNAVIIAHADRWDRGSKEAKEALEVFRARGIRFFIGVTEYELTNPEHVLFLDLSSAIGKFQAANQRKKSLLNRIERAKRGIPSGGNLPHARLWDETTQTWSVDEPKKALIVEAARRYLGGESLTDLARVVGVSQETLTRTLRMHCGDSWELHFKSPDLKIDELVTLTVPRLLEEETIKAIKQRLLARKTYKHGKPKHSYLLGSYIFCESCNRLLQGQTNRSGHAYYRHNTRAAQETGCPGKWHRCDRIDREVIDRLFVMFGSPAHIERAVKSAIPQVDEALQRQGWLTIESDRVARARQQILALIAKDMLTEAQAEAQLGELKERDKILASEREGIDQALAEVPSEEMVKLYVEKFAGMVWVYDQELNGYVGGNDIATEKMMTYSDKRKLVDSVFDCTLADGRPAGVYVQSDGSLTLRGRLEFESVMAAVGVTPSCSGLSGGHLPGGSHTAPSFILDAA